jgi:hypothetical protein
MFSTFGIVGGTKPPVFPEQPEQREQSKQREQSEQPEQREQPEQSEQREQCEQREQFVQSLQSMRLSSAFCAASADPKYSTLHLFPFVSFNQVVMISVPLISRASLVPRA